MGTLSEDRACKSRARQVPVRNGKHNVSPTPLCEISRTRAPQASVVRESPALTVASSRQLKRSVCRCPEVLERMLVTIAESGKVADLGNLVLCAEMLFLVSTSRHRSRKLSAFPSIALTTGAKAAAILRPAAGFDQNGRHRGRLAGGSGNCRRVSLLATRSRAHDSAEKDAGCGGDEGEGRGRRCAGSRS